MGIGGGIGDGKRGESGSTAPGGTPRTAGPFRAALRLGLLCLAVPVLGGCFGDSPADRSEPTSRPPSSIPVSVSQPHARGPISVRLGIGLPVLTAERCEPSARRVCSTDATRSWAPVEQTVGATVTDARTRLARGHVSWTTVLTFSPQDADGLARQSRRASALGGDVLVLGSDRMVLTALPPSTVRGDRAVLSDLEKGAAWAVVEGFSRDQGGH